MSGERLRAEFTPATHGGWYWDVFDGWDKVATGYRPTRWWAKRAALRAARRALKAAPDEP